MEPCSEYGRIFDCTNAHWTANQNRNLVYCKHMLDFCDQVVKARGYLFLNDVYELLGIQRIREGQTMGWTCDGMAEVEDAVSIGFCEPVELNANVMIDFRNIQENILHALPKNEEL